jgi:hypothetical protein
MNPTAPPPAPSLLASIGEALFGSDWVSVLAAALQVNRRTVQRWRSGAAPVPSGALTAVADLALARAAELAPLASQARAAAVQAPPGYWQRGTRENA